MSRPREEDYVFYQGEKFQVEFYFTEKGELPAREYFDSLERRVQVKLLTLVKYIAEHGRLFDQTKFRQVDKEEKIYEFKPVAERFFNFFHEGQKIIITNAYRKQRQKTDRQALARAVGFKRDYEFRVKGGGYYENQKD